MFCSNCKSEKLQVVSEYIELKEKKIPKIVSIITTFGFLSLFVSIIMILIPLANLKDDMLITTVPAFIIGLDVLSFSITCFLISGLIKALLPYQHTTRLRVVCLECGYSSLLKTNERPPICADIEKTIISELNKLNHKDKTRFLREELFMSENSSDVEIMNKLMIMRIAEKNELLTNIADLL